MIGRTLSRRSLAWAAVSLACALVAAVSIRVYARAIEAAHPASGRQVPVQVATRALERGTRLSPDMLRATRLPSAYVPPGSIGSADRLVGRILASDIAAGEVVTSTRLAQDRVGPVAALVTPEMRGLVIPSGLPPGTVAPGDLVDVFGAYGGGAGHVELLAEDAQVVRIVASPAVTIPGTDRAGSPSLVLVVDPATARRLADAIVFARLVVTVDPPGGSSTDHLPFLSPPPSGR